jgi:hypothetical protein
MGEAGLPMILGFLLELFGPRSLPWTILMCAIAQAVLYMAVHVLAAEGAHEQLGEDVGGDKGEQTDRYRNVSVGTEEESTAEEDDVEMTAL